MDKRVQLRKIALSLPESQEKSHFGQPDFRVQGKIFAGLAREGEVGWLKVAIGVQTELVKTRPEVFSAAAGAWGHSGWTYVQLPEVKLAELRTLIWNSWHLVAPKALSAAVEPRSSARAASPPSKRRVR